MPGMRVKTIKSVLSKKFNAWLESIEHPDLREKVKSKTIITGGCIASMLLGEEVNDFGLYFRDKETCKAVALYYVGKFSQKDKNGIGCNISVRDVDDRISVVIKSAGIASEDSTEKPHEYFEASGPESAGEYVGDVMRDPAAIEDAYDEAEQVALNTTTGAADARPKYRPVFMSTNAITLSDKVQVILRFHGEPDQIHENYDFAHCTCYWQSWGGGELVLRQPALEALLAKELRYVGSKYPVCSLIRLRKFISRGWKINAGQILKIAMQVSKLDLTSYAVMRDQLTGVDVAYFMQLLSKLNERDPAKVDYAYLVEIIDRMF